MALGSNRAVVVAKDEAYRRGHLPMRDDERQGGRLALICVHCGARATKQRGRADLVGTLVARGGKCIGFEPRSRRDVELAELDAGDAWDPSPHWSAIEVANWTVKVAWGQHRALGTAHRAETTNAVAAGRVCHHTVQEGCTGHGDF